MVPLGISNGKYKVDPVGLTVRYEMMFTGSVKDSNSCYLVVLSQYKADNQNEI